MAAPRHHGEHFNHTPESDASLTRLWLDGAPYGSIIIQLGALTRRPWRKAMIQGRLRRLKLPRRDDPVKTQGSKPGKPTRAEREAVAQAILPDRPLAETPVTFRRRSTPCAWPVEKMGRAWRFCEADSVPGKPYCAECGKLAYMPRPARERDAESAVV